MGAVTMPSSRSLAGILRRASSEPVVTPRTAEATTASAATSNVSNSGAKFKWPVGLAEPTHGTMSKGRVSRDEVLSFE